MTLPVFKTGGWSASRINGAFDSHTLPPFFSRSAAGKSSGLKKHTAVSDEDFSKEPTRNRLAVFLSRTNHASFHTGQIALTK